MWGVIPQLFYDLLARIVPGSTLIMLTAAVVTDYEDLLKAEWLKETTSVKFCCLILTSYLIGFLLGELSELLPKRCLKRIYKKATLDCKKDCLRQHNRMLTGVGKPALTLRLSDLPEVPVMRNHLRYVDSDDAARLLKVRSERRLCEVFVPGIMIVWIVDLVFLFRDRNSERVILAVVLPLLIIPFLFRAVRSHKHLANGTTTGWLFGVLPKIK